MMFSREERKRSSVTVSEFSILPNLVIGEAKKIDLEMRID